MIENKAYLYCKKAVKENTTPKFVKLQMKDFMRICEGKNKKYKISEKKLKQLNGLLKLLNMPKGLKAGRSLYECTSGWKLVQRNKRGDFGDAPFFSSGLLL